MDAALDKFTMQALSGDTLCRGSPHRSRCRKIPKGQTWHSGKQYVGNRDVSTALIDPLSVPLIVVFTKLDLLENMLRAEALVDRKILDEDTLHIRKNELLNRACFATVQKVTGNANLPYVTLSST